MGCCHATGELQEDELASGVGDQKPRLSAISFNSSNFVSTYEGSILDLYNLQAIIGQGAFGKVYVGVSRLNGMRRAIKALDRSALTPESRDRIRREIEILKELDHPNIIRIIEVVEDERYINIVQELCQGGELFDRIVKNKRFSEDLAAGYMRQILSAVTHCHKASIIHRDLKPENILFESTGANVLKVIDFGISRKHFAETPLRKQYGTVSFTQAYYMAPEVLRGSYNEKCDVWSCGVLMYILLSGYPPFNGSTQQDIRAKVKAGQYTMTGGVWPIISPEAKDLINQLLTFDPAKRISAEQAFQHPWLHSGAQPSPPLQEAQFLQNLTHFYSVQKFKQAALTYIAGQLLSGEEVSSLRTTFADLDTDGDGRLSREELLIGYRRSSLPLVNIDKVIRTCDIDKNGFVDYTEFITAALDWQSLLSKELLENAFRIFDRDSSGTITKDELKAILKGEEAQGDEVWEMLIKQADKNGDGMVRTKQIDMEEFKNLMLTRTNTGDQADE
jgi:calcium-dependent protein kinase